MLALFGPPPSFQDNLTTLDALRRQLACSPPSLQTLYEKRYPYLDRSLLEFMYAVPCEQLVRPGQRRSLMRRALVGIVPDDLLNRKRKAFVSRTPTMGISSEYGSLIEIGRHMVSASLGIVDSGGISEVLSKLRRGHVVPLGGLMRTVAIERWLRQLAAARNVKLTCSAMERPLIRSLYGRQEATHHGAPRGKRFRRHGTLISFSSDLAHF